MRVRMKSNMAGPNISAGPGAVVDVDKAFAYALIEGGHAEQVEDAAEVVAPVEVAVVAAPETTEARRPEPKARPEVLPRKLKRK